MLFAPVIRRTSTPSLRSADLAFERFFNGSLQAPAAKNYSFEQNDTSFTLQLDVPGIGKEQLAVDIEGAVVRISSLADAPRQFKAAYELPQDIDTSASDAELENGVLTLKLVKEVPVSNATELVVH
mgnify:CR=1 FL=1